MSEQLGMPEDPFWSLPTMWDNVLSAKPNRPIVEGLISDPEQTMSEQTAKQAGLRGVDFDSTDVAMRRSLVEVVDRKISRNRYKLTKLEEQVQDLEAQNNKLLAIKANFQIQAEEE